MAGDDLKDTQMDQSTGKTSMNEAFFQAMRQIVAAVSAQQMSATAQSAPTQSGVQDLNELKGKSADTSQPSDVATTSSMKRRLTRGDKKLLELATEETDLPANPAHKKLKRQMQEPKVETHVATTAKKKAGWPLGKPRNVNKRIADSKKTPVPNRKAGWPLGKPRGSKHQITELPGKKHQAPKKRLTRLSTKQEESAEEKSTTEKGQEQTSEQDATAQKDQEGANKVEASMEQGVRGEKQKEKGASSKVCLNEEQALEFMSSIKERLFGLSVRLTDINRNLFTQNALIAEQNHLTKDMKELVIQVKDKCLPSGQ